MKLYINIILFKMLIFVIIHVQFQAHDHLVILMYTYSYNILLAAIFSNHQEK